MHPAAFFTISNCKAVVSSSMMFLLSSSLLVLLCITGSVQFGSSSESPFVFLEDTPSTNKNIKNLLQELLASASSEYVPPVLQTLEQQQALLKHVAACVADSPEAVQLWDDLDPDRRPILEYRGWTAERWNRDGNKCLMPQRISTPEAFYVHVVKNISVPSALASMNSSTLSGMDSDQSTSIRLVSGYDDYNEDFVTSKSFAEIFQGIKQGDTSFYLHLEEEMPEKEAFQHLVGDLIIHSLLPLVREHQELHRPGLWNPKWDAIDPHLKDDDSYDWAMFAGAKGTKTPLHYDDDLFNFLYLIEGRKRIVIIPNDSRTRGTFTTHQNNDGGTGWGELDVFAENATWPEHTVEVVLEAGQAIALPYLCWHAVYNLEDALAVSLRLVDW
jgi:Cupin-like domain